MHGTKPTFAFLRRRSLLLILAALLALALIAAIVYTRRHLLLQYAIVGSWVCPVELSPPPNRAVTRFIYEFDWNGSARFTYELRVEEGHYSIVDDRHIGFRGSSSDTLGIFTIDIDGDQMVITTPAREQYSCKRSSFWGRRPGLVGY